MIVLTENKKISVVKPVYLTESQISTIKKAGLLEASNLPAIAKMGGVSTNPKITSVARQSTIFSTVQAMGLPVKINRMNNIVAEAPDGPTASAVMSTIYQMFGVKSSIMLTWEGTCKIYWSPETKPDTAPILAYSKATGLPPPNPRKYLA
jgi:hypothetical protein